MIAGSWASTPASTRTCRLEGRVDPALTSVSVIRRNALCHALHQGEQGERMTVAVVVKVFDGIVVAADSATTLPLANGSAQVYNNANKIFHLHRRLPLAAMTWGL